LLLSVTMTPTMTPTHTYAGAGNHDPDLPPLWSHGTFARTGVAFIQYHKKTASGRVTRKLSYGPPPVVRSKEEAVRLAWADPEPV
jgi:hypothetical protein